MKKSKSFYKTKERPANGGYFVELFEIIGFCADMKKFVFAICAMLPLVSAAEKNRIAGTLAPSDGGAAAVENTGEKNYTVSVKFDLSKIAGKDINSARLAALCEMSGGQKTSPSLTFSYKGREFDAATLVGAGGTMETRIDVFDIVKAAIANGEKSAEFKIFSKCPVDSAPKVEIKHAAIVAVDGEDRYELADALTPVFGGGKMRGESVFPLGGEDGSEAKARLLFAPKKIDAAYTYRDGKKTALKEGTDFKISGDTVEFIIVSSMRANPLWSKSMAIQDKYPEVDKSFECESVAVANVRAAHDALLEKKRYIDMTGNNVNHPNKFLINVYAQTILKLLEK